MSSFTIESSSLSNLLLHLNENQMKTMFSNKNISNDIKTKLRPYSSAKITIITNNTVYLLQDSKKGITAQLTILQTSKHVNPELEIFTLENKMYKEAMNNYEYRLTLLKNTYFDKDITQDEERLEQLKKQYQQQEIEIEQKKQLLIDKWNIEREKLYADRKSLILRNKEIYEERKKLSTTFYSSSEETRSKKEYIEEIRTLLQESEQNKNSILEINQNIDVLDRKCNLYLSETFLYQPLSEITIQLITKEEETELLSKKGGKYKSYDLEFLEALESEPLDNSVVKRYYYNMKNDIKKLSKKGKTKSKTNRQVFQELQF